MRTYDSPYTYIIYGKDKIWGIADSLNELDKLCEYIGKASSSGFSDGFEIYVFEGLHIIGSVPISRRTDLCYPVSMWNK